MRLPILFSLLGTAVLAIGCSSGPSPFATDGDGTAKLAEHAWVVPSQLTDAAEVKDDRLLFPASAFDQLKGHDILIGDRADTGTKNPEGFLRRVVSVEKNGNTTVVMTQPATLQEAVEELDFTAQLDTPELTAKGPKIQGITDGIRPLGTGKPISLIDFSGTTIIDETASIQVDAQHNVGFRVFATITKGTVGFTPKWDVGASLGFLTIKSFHATATGQIDAELELDAGIKLTTNIDSATFTKLVAQKILRSPSKTLADYDVNLGKLKVGPLSIPVSAHFTTTLDCDFELGGGAEVVVGGTANATVTAGVKYEKGNLSPVFAKSLTLAQTGPNWTLDGLTKIKCSVQPRFTMKLFGVASGEIWANGYVDVGGSLTCGGKDANGNQMAQVDGAAGAGASAGVKAKVDVLGLIKWSKACTLFDVDKSAAYTTKFALPGGQNATCTGTEAYKRDTHTADPKTCFGGGDQGATDGGGSVNMGGSCGHDECTPGEKLGSQCSPCVQKVCAKDAYCCDTFWGPSCMAQVASICGYTCQ